MSQTYLESSNIISSLGWNTAEAFNTLRSGKGGIRICTDRRLSDHDFPASLIRWEELEQRFSQIGGADAMTGGLTGTAHLAEGAASTGPGLDGDSTSAAGPGLDGETAASTGPGLDGETADWTRFEKLAILSMHDALSDSSVDPADPRTALILSTTKGNVELLDQQEGFGKERLHLWKSAELMARFFGMKNRPVVISNACISGVVAMITARRLILSGRYDHAIVVGADVVSKFIVSGFQSFLSLSDLPCKPFDEHRDGLTLGEAAGTVIISGQYGDVELTGGAVTNDANHISGPSRNGEGLLLAITNTLVDGQQPDLISAHGTATVYNDEMESIALSRAGLEHVPVNSLKGAIGHTLGAAGIVESIINIEAMKQDILIPTMGYSKPGVSGEINVVDRPEKKQIRTMLKVASGFGGCNAAALFKRRV
ncbi:MAG: beta-ketoacyl synthase N-terminal-like domain-containing protein [Bacteroidota bacterium]